MQAKLNRRGAIKFLLAISTFVGVRSSYGQDRKVSYYYDFDNTDKFQIKFKGETLTITPEEIWEALDQGERASFELPEGSI
jgi:hypothetical protein